MRQWPRTSVSKRAASARSDARRVTPSHLCSDCSRLVAEDVPCQMNHVHQARPVTVAHQDVAGAEPSLRDAAMPIIDRLRHRPASPTMGGNTKTVAMSSPSLGLVGFDHQHKSPPAATSCRAMGRWVSNTTMVTTRPSRTTWRHRSSATGLSFVRRRPPVGPGQAEAMGQGREERRARRALLRTAPPRFAVDGDALGSVLRGRGPAQAPVGLRPQLASIASRSPRRKTVWRVAAHGGRRVKPKARIRRAP